MTTNSLRKIDQKEYLKKYLSGDKVKKKKKDKKHKKSSSSSAKVKIIDDDINHLDIGPHIDEELLLTGDDAPQIVGEYIEESPAESKLPKWRTIGIKEDVLLSDARDEEYLWKKKSGDLKTKKIYSVNKRHSVETPEFSPLRREGKKREERKDKNDKSPHRRRTSVDDSTDYRKKIKREPIITDKSPPRRRQFRDNNSSSPRRQKSPSPAYSPSRRRQEFVGSVLRKDNDDQSDQSPPRKGRHSLSDKSPPRRGRENLPDQSAHRKGRKRTTEQSASRKRKNSDQTIPRKSTVRSPDQSPQIKRYAENSTVQRGRVFSPDQSPPRKGSNHLRDLSPPRRKRKNSDQSSKKGKNRSPDQSPTRYRRSSNHLQPAKGRNQTPDQSPPRRRNSDQSPHRRNRNCSPKQKKLFSPLRSGRTDTVKHIKDEKLSPDLSPPLPRRSRWERQESEKSFSPPPTHKPKPGKTLEGKKAGLQDAQALLKESLERRKQEDLLFERMSSDISGRHAEVQVRSTGRKGRRARKAGEEDPEERKRKEEHEEKKKQLYDRWGKGLKQIEDHKNRLLEEAHESSKPLARYEDDEDLERHLKEQERAEDPMLEYMRQKRKEKEKQSGKPQIPRYEGPFPENRFGIRPGYRWDGVDRSNGYEKKYFSVQNEKRARQDEAYKYSVEDM